MPTKQTASEKLQKAALHRKQGLALELAARAEKIFAIIKSSAELCSACEAALEDSGVDMASHFKNDVEPKAKAAKKKVELDPLVSLPRTTTALGGLHQDILQHLLTNLGEAVITAHALNALKPTPKKSIPKVAIQELLEFATECGPSTWIGTTGPLKILGNLQQALAELNKLHGHRLRCVPLPPQWDMHGVYQISVKGESIYVTHKFLTERATRSLPADQVAVVSDAKNLQIEANYSSKGAILMESDGVLSYPLRKLFKDVFPDDPFEDVKAFILTLPTDGAGNASTQPMLTGPKSKVREPEHLEPVKQPFNVKRMGSQSTLQGSQKRHASDSPADPSGKTCSPNSKKDEPAEVGQNNCRKDLSALFESAGDSPEKVPTELDMELPEAEV